MSKSHKGKVFPEETKRKLSASLKGRKVPKDVTAKQVAARRSGKGWVPSIESRRKNSESHKGVKLSDETRRKISVASGLRTHSEAVRKKISDSHKGKRHTEESRQKIAQARIGQTSSDQTKERISKKHKDLVWMCDPAGKTSKVTKLRVPDLLIQGWIIGRKLS